MEIDRREFIVLTGAVGFAVAAPGVIARYGASDMYGLIGKIHVVPGKRDELVSILLDGVAGMPGCLSYIIANDSTDSNAIWVTEVWDSQKSHEASLTLPSVKDAIARGKPLIAGFGDRYVTQPVGGHGIPSS